MTRDPIGQHQKPHYYMLDGWWVCLYMGRIGHGRTPPEAHRGWWNMHATQTDIRKGKLWDTLGQLDM